MSIIQAHRSVKRGLFSKEIRKCLGWSLAAKRECFSLIGALVIMSTFLAACSGTSVEGNTTSTSSIGGANAVALSQLRWCNKPLMIFRDERRVATPGAGTTTPSVATSATAIDDWSQFKQSLGFTVFLPQTLPAGSCLLSTSGTVHDPVFGSSFTIGYLLPDHSPLSLSEAPVRNAQNSAFQCSPSSATGTAEDAQGGARDGLVNDASTGLVNDASTGLVNDAPTRRSQGPLQLCSGARDKTSIVFSAKGTTTTLEQFFRALRPDVDWLPA